MRVLPDYKGGSIVNLMSSLAKGLGGTSRYRESRLLPASEVAKAKNVVLLVVDGMGYEFFRQYGKEHVFSEGLQGKMTSCFPSTTAACIPLFLTGVPPQQHALTGWHVYLKELGVVSTILLYVNRYGGESLLLPVDWLMDQPSFFSQVKAKCFSVAAKKIQSSEFSHFFTKDAVFLNGDSLKGLFRGIRKGIQARGRKKYIYAYWPGVDSLCHEFGTKSLQAFSHFHEIGLAFQSFLKSIKGTNTLVVVTADHGLIDTEEKKVVWLEEHPRLQECLVLPLAGDMRTQNCYVRPSKEKEFVRYVRQRLKKVCWLHKGEELIKKGYYGLGKPNKKLFDRVGDYVLIMKENYILKDRLMTEPPKVHVGNHGGLSKEEMFVPLIVVRT